MILPHMNLQNRYLFEPLLLMLSEDYYDRNDDKNKTELKTGRNRNGRPSTVLTPVEETGMAFSTVFDTIQ